jgi:hypothetical protein
VEVAMLNIARILFRGLSHSGRDCCVAAVLALMSGAMGVAGLPEVGQVQAARLEGQRFEDTAVVADRTLRLNGLGLRGVAWIKAFVAGLYLAAPTRDGGQAMAMQGPKRLRMKLLMEAPSREFSKAIRGGVRKNESEQMQGQLADRLAAFSALIDGIGTLRSGDTIDLDWLPGQGLQLLLNHRPVGAVTPGEDFYRSVLKIFIGERPVDPRMKEGLLRGGS